MSIQVDRRTELVCPNRQGRVRPATQVVAGFADIVALQKIGSGCHNPPGAANEKVSRVAVGGPT